MLEVDYTTSLDAVDRAAWRGLAERAGHVFATPEWLSTWWRHYGEPGRALMGVARAGGEVVSILPLHVWWKQGVPVLRFIGHGPSDRLGPIGGPGQTAVGAVIAAIPRRRFVLLAENLAPGEGFGALAGFRPLYRDSSPVLRFRAATWDEFLSERGPNFRQQARRFPRRLSEVGPVSFRLASDPDRLARDLDVLFDLHRRRWGTEPTPFLRAAPFHRDFAAQAFAQGWLRLWFLEVGGRPVAACYGFRFAGTESAYQAGRDPRLDRVSVGSVLLTHVIRRALEDGMGEFRLLRGGAAYKDRFATDDPGIETYGLARGVSARAALGAALAVRGRSLGLRRLLDRS